MTPVFVVLMLQLAPGQAAETAAPAEEVAAEAPAPADAAPADAAPADGAPADGEAPAEELEFVGDDQPIPEDDDIPMALPVPEDDPDTVAPEFEDFAIAADNPDAAPRVTAVVTDDLSGIDNVSVLFRLDPEHDFQSVKMTPGAGGLFMGLLPQGVQTNGFEYYVEATDADGNVGRLGSEETPYRVDAAGASTLVRLKAKEPPPPKGPVLHPAWIALAMGVGVLSGAVAAGFWFDLAGLQLAIQQDNLSASREADLQQASYGDAIVAGILSAVSVAGMSAGTGLLIYAVAFDE